MNKRSLSIITAIAVIALPIIGWAAYTGPTGNPTSGNPPGPVWLSPSSAQTGDINVSGFMQSSGDIISTSGDIISSNGDLITSAGDVYIPNGKAIRVDQGGTSASALNVGNWMGTGGMYMNVYGDVYARGTANNGTIYTRTLCLNNGAVPATDCRNTWPSGGATDIWVNTTGDTMTGILNVSRSGVGGSPSVAVYTPDNATNGYVTLLGSSLPLPAQGNYYTDAGSYVIGVSSQVFSGGGQDIGVAGAGIYGVYGNGTTAGVYANGATGVNAVGSTTGVDGQGSTTGIQGSATASNGVGVRGIGKYGGGYFEGTSGVGVQGSGSTYGVYGQGATMGGRFEDTNNSTSAYLAYSNYSFLGTGQMSNSGSLNLGGSLYVADAIETGDSLYSYGLDVAGNAIISGSVSTGALTATTINAGTVTASGSLNGASLVTTGNITANSNSWGTQTTQPCPDVTTTGPCQCPSGTFMTGVVRRTTSPYHVTSIYCNEL